MPELNNARRRRTIRADFAWKNLLVFAKRRSEYIVGLLDPASGRYRVTAIGICRIQRNKNSFNYCLRGNAQRT
jgi:hypothetical protein